MCNNRSFIGGHIFNCLACNRALDSVESTRTYPQSKELIGLCNSCIKASKETEYSHQHILADAQDGITPSRYVDNHSGYWYEFFD